MIIFKTYLKIVKKYKVPILLYTFLLLFFGGFNLKTEQNQMNFQASKPKISIKNEDQEGELTKHFLSYLNQFVDVKEIKEEEQMDALFYRDINCVLTIPKNFSDDFFKFKNSQISFKSTGDYLASLTEIYINRYMKMANTYLNSQMSQKEILNALEKNVKENVTVEMVSKVDTNYLEKASTYFNFSNYCLLAGCIYVICLILNSFKKEDIKKRTEVSCLNSTKKNVVLLLSNGLFAFSLWFFYSLISFILLGKNMFSWHGFLYCLNAFVFTGCILTLAFLLGNIIRNKNTINGIINVIALGSSFLCGAFVPMEFLPKSVLKLAHLFPSYYFILNNELIKNIEKIQLETLKPMIWNGVFLLLFSIFFVSLTIFLSKKKGKQA